MRRQRCDQFLLDLFFFGVLVLRFSFEKAPPRSNPRDHSFLFKKKFKIWIRCELERDITIRNAFCSFFWRNSMNMLKIFVLFLRERETGDAIFCLVVWICLVVVLLFLFLLRCKISVCLSETWKTNASISHFLLSLSLFGRTRSVSLSSPSLSAVCFSFFL